MRLMTATAALAAVGALTCGCGTDSSTSSDIPTVSRDALQNDIATRLRSVGDQPRTVTCESDLLGEVGRTARCEVVVSDVNSLQPIVTVTGIVGQSIEYELTPALSRHQLEGAVERLVAERLADRVDAVACESGLMGQVGSKTLCDIDSDGTQASRIVAVTAVSGLTIDFNLQTS